MKKALRVGGKFLKVYTCLNILLWAYVGIAEWFNRCLHAIKEKDYFFNVYEELIGLFDESTRIWKEFIKESL